MSGKAKQQSRLKELIARGKEQGYLTYTEVNRLRQSCIPLLCYVQN